MDESLRRLEGFAEWTPKSTVGDLLRYNNAHELVIRPLLDVVGARAAHAVDSHNHYLRLLARLFDLDGLAWADEEYGLLGRVLLWRTPLTNRDPLPQIEAEVVLHHLHQDGFSCDVWQLYGRGTGNPRAIAAWLGSSEEFQLEEHVAQQPSGAVIDHYAFLYAGGGEWLGTHQERIPPRTRLYLVGSPTASLHVHTWRLQRLQETPDWEYDTVVPPTPA